MLGSRLDETDAVFRRFLPGQYVEDANLGRRRLSSAAFEKRDDEDHASCYAESLMRANGLQPHRVLDDNEELGLARIPVATLRQHEFDAAEDPDGVDPDVPHSCDPAHSALINPPNLGRKPLKRRAGELSKDEEISVLREPVI